MNALITALLLSCLILTAVFMSTAIYRLAEGCAI